MTRGKLELDDKDRKIISLLQGNPDISQLEIARRVKISQPSIAARIERLKQRGVISSLIGINFKKAGLYLAKVDATVNDTGEILERLKECPYFLIGFVTSGKNNLCLFFASENLTTLEAVVNSHLRSTSLAVRGLNFNVVTAPPDFIFPVKMDIERQELLSCKIKCQCETCYYYKIERCLGCPLTEYYKGTFWQATTSSL